ncbi:unnamed protein product [Clonostachys chloroleuca]|uniref:F-box domain-containing protein n=1 Tax=Clonostachys chloroleuca TaxID=1926264 RepID=A0AA35LQ03_9HYPO|nr:unnamed protein product [Clonostachys chloroleuca]
MAEVIMTDVTTAESVDQESQSAVQKAFPGEIHNHIAGMLGPVDLISLSQTNRYFRQLINPGKKELAERLFVIECKKKHGGGTSLFYTTADDHTHLHDKLEPFEANRWACPGCLQLLPHHRFDNQSIYRLATRKPMPGTLAADIASSWVPTQHREDSKEEDKRMRQDIYRYYTLPRSEADDEDDPVLLNERCGYDRYKRRCIECQYQLGMIGGSSRDQLPPIPPSSEERLAGTVRTTSTLTSRAVMLSSGFVRFWPKLDEMIESKAPTIAPLGSNSIPWRREDKLWDMYMIRCTGCEGWKELRAFRIEGTRLDWTPLRFTTGIPQWLPRDVAKNDEVPKLENRPLAELRCNHCFAREHGAERLGEILAIRFEMNIKPHLSELEYRLHSHYKAVKYLGADGAAEKHRPKEDPSGHFEELVRLVRQAEENNRELSDNRQWSLNQADVDRLRTEAKEFKDIWIRMRTSLPRLASKLGRDRAFISWINDFNNSEIEWKWLKECQAKILENPALLLQWALNLDAPGCCYPSTE